MNPYGVGELERFICLRRETSLPAAGSAPLLANAYTPTASYTGSGLSYGLQALFRKADILRPDGRPPRVHDLRHGFAVRALLRWYREGVDVQTKLPQLALYMGHVSIVSTAYYLPFFLDIASAASDRFEAAYAHLIEVPKGSAKGELL